MSIFKKVGVIMIKKLLILPFITAILILAGCEAQKNTNAAVESAIAEAKAAMEKVNALEAKEAGQEAQIAAANKTAQRAEAMTEQNRSALRALNDKIDRMFRTISRK